MRPLCLDALAGILTLLLSVPAHANCPVVETHTGARPARADERLRPMFDVFEERGCLSGRALTLALARYSRAGISVSEDEIQSLGSRIDNGINLLRKEEFARATEQFQQAIDIARGASAALARDHSLRTTALRAYVGLALAFKRWGERLQQARDREAAARAFANAEKWMAEGVRSFPGMEPDRTRGKEAVEWWREIRERQLASPTGTLVADPGDDGVSVFLQEGYMGRGLTTKTGLPPGTYRVYTERAEVSGRVHTVEVRAGEVTRLVLNWRFDSTLRTGPWVGFEYESPIEHRERRGMDAGRIASMLHEPYAIIVGLSSRGDGQYAFGLTVNPSGKALVSGEVLLDDSADTDAILRHFALALSMRGASSKAVPVQGIAPLNLDANPLPWIERPMVASAHAAQGRSRWRRVSQVAIGLGALGAVGSSAVYLASPDDDHTMPTYDDRKTPAVEVFVGSSIVVGAGLYLYLRESRSTSIVTAAMLGVGTTALLSGAMLYATDEDLYYGSGWQRKYYRDSAIPGLIVGSAGVALTGVGIWLLMRDHRSTSMPIAFVERGKGFIGLTGNF
jgi:hypothetical protein